MKGIFAFCMVFAALVCFAMPTDCKASVMPTVDNDVGFVIGEPSGCYGQIAMPESVPLPESMAKDEITPPSVSRKSRTAANSLNACRWLYGDTKARLCNGGDGTKSCSKSIGEAHDIAKIPKT